MTKQEAYCQYLRDWADSHSDIGFEGCCPACFDEWVDSEPDAGGDSMQVVHILLYNDPKASYVGLDVFASYDAAFQQFQQRLKETEEAHPEDEEWIEAFTAQCGNDDLYFRDKDGYEVLYMLENVQKGDV